MLEITGNIFDIPDADAICVTTNGIVKKNGELVMGAGIALAFKNRWPHVAAYLGDKVKKYGNHCHHVVIDVSQTNVVSFPTKHHWHDPSELELIKRSALELVKLADE